MKCFREQFPANGNQKELVVLGTQKCLLTKHTPFSKKVKLILRLFSASSYELQLYMACPPDSAPLCTPSQAEGKYAGPGPTASLEGLRPYTAYKVRVVAHNEVGSAASEWISFITHRECE